MSAEYQLNNPGRFKKGHVPWSKGKKGLNKGFKHSDETKQRLSESKKGAKNPMYGKHLSDKTKKKISKSLKGKPRSEEVREKSSKAMIEWNKAHPPWNKGKTNVYSKDHLKKISNQKKGKKNPMFGVSRVVPEKEKKGKECITET